LCTPASLCSLPLSLTIARYCTTHAIQGRCSTGVRNRRRKLPNGGHAAMHAVVPYIPRGIRYGGKVR